MPWTYSRIDRIETGVVHCEFCGRGLPSGRVIVLKDDAGVEAYSGPACAKKHVGDPTEPILDLSKLALLMVVRDTPQDHPEPGDVSSAPQPGRSGSRRQAFALDEVTTYLRLRTEHMSGFKGHVTERLREIHQQLGSDSGLGDSQRLYVERLLAKSKADNSIYSLRNVGMCVAACHWLRVAIANTKSDRREFLESLLESLFESWKLSKGQLDALNRWGVGVRKVVPDFPVLDSTSFSGVAAPQYGASQKSKI